MIAFTLGFIVGAIAVSLLTMDLVEAPCLTGDDFYMGPTSNG